MKKLGSLLVTLAASIVLFGAVTTANATKIEYTQSGNTLNFTVYNDTLPVAISFFDVFFGATTDGLNFTNTGAYASVSDGTAPTGWTSFAFAPTVLGNPWVYSAGVDTGAPIAGGDHLGGFSTTLTFTTAAPLGHLWFNVYDDSFVTLDSGYTTLRDNGNPNAVPEPSTMLLLGAGLGGLLFYRRKNS